MPWWNMPIRALQFNIEDPYGFYGEMIDADKLVRLAKKVKANMITVFARDAWGRVFYEDSRIYPRHPNSRLDVKELVEKARREGIRVVIMVAHTANRYIYRLHPSWAQRSREGEVIVLEHYPKAERIIDPHWPQICPNSPALDNFFVPEVEEALRITNADGVLLDSFRYMPDPQKACFCNYCREEFRREYGMDLPFRDTIESEAFRQAWEWRYKVVQRSIAKLREAAKKVKSDVFFFYNSHPAGWAGRGNIAALKTRDYLDAVFAEASEADIRGPGLLTIITKLSRAIMGDGKPVIVSRNLFYALRTVQSATRHTVRQGVWEIVASGGNPMATIFSSQYVEDPRALDYLASVYEELEKLEEYLVDTTPIRYIGVIFDPETYDKYYWSRPEHYVGEVEGFAMMAFDRNIPWEFVTTPDIVNVDHIARYPVIIAPGMSVVGDDEEEALREYVARGGVLVASHELGIMRTDYTYRHSLALEDVLGVHYEGLLWFGYSFIHLGEPGEETYEEFWKGLPRALIFGDPSAVFVRERAEPRLGELVRARPTTARVLAWSRLGRSAYGYEYTLGRSAPAPDSVLNLAGITLSRYGEGYSIYYAVRLGAHYTRLGYPDYADILLRPLYKVAGRPPVLVKGPETLQLEAYRQGDRILIHIVNHTYNQRILSAPTGPSKQALPAFDPVYRVHPIKEVIPVGPVRVLIDRRLAGDVGNLTVYNARTGDKLRTSINRDYIEILVPEIDDYALIVVEPRE
ncbi:MAG: hypothetical protein F7C81_04255 [Desulfurococcales archaeon]|nr:hypothetical protein [Desulfurococcales archaeon]